MNLLFLCLENFPHEGACTSLLLNLLSQKAISNIGKIHVLALSNKSELPPLETINGIFVHRFRSVTRMQNMDILSQWGKNVKRSTYEIWFRVRKHFPFLFRRGNHFYNITLVNETIEALKDIVDRENIDLIIPVCGYYEAAVAALDICKRNNIALGVYQVDPCSTNQLLPPLTFQERLTFERTLYDYAKFVISTPIIGSEMAQYLTLDQRKKTVIMEFPNVVPRASSSNGAHKGTIRCLFAGKIYAGARDPSYTLRLFSKISDPDIVLELIGIDAPGLTRYTNGQLPSNIICRGNLPLEETRKEIDSADILVNIGNTVKNQVPSKLFEYIASGKPIVNICVDRSCPSVPYMELYPKALNIYQSDEKDLLVENQANVLYHFIKANCQGTVSSDQIMNLFYKCTPEYCSSLMAQEIVKALASSDE